MFSDNNKTYLAILLLAVVVFGVLFTFKGMVKAQIDARAIAAYEQDYLSALRDPDLGCRTLYARRPEVILLGDSHTYAGWDFNVLQKELGKHVGGCMIGGAYISTLHDLLVKITDLKPQRIIIGLSPRMFWDSETRIAQIENSKEMISKLDGGLEEIRDLFKPAQFKDSQSVAQTKLQKHASIINSLDERLLSKALDASPDQVSLARWKERFGVLRTRYEEGVEVIKQICALVNRNKLSLSVVYMPESAYLESQYSSDLWNAFEDSVQAFEYCAEYVIVRKSGYYGLGNRHFVNRYLKESMSYDSFIKGVHVANVEAFDMDHMNPIGASIFTRRIAALIQAASLGVSQ